MKLSNETLQFVILNFTMPLSVVESSSTVDKVALELAKQEADRTKVELAAAQRKHIDEVKTLRDTLDAKDVQIQNW